VSHIASRIRSAGRSVAVVATLACTTPRSSPIARHDALPHAVAHSSRSSARAGIAIVGSGGRVALQRTTVIDSATARFMTVTRTSCRLECAPIDSASGTLAEADVAHIYAVVDQEHVFSLRASYGVCEGCTDQMLFTTAVFANNRRKVITSDGEATLQVLGRVHLAVAEAIRSARAGR
jgi:hypothetical protein